MTSQGYPAGKRAFPAWARTCHPSLGSGRRGRLQQWRGRMPGCLPRGNRRATLCAGADGESPASRRSGGNAAALKCDGAAGPEKQDKREESANG